MSTPKKERSGIPRYLICKNELVNDSVWITHTQPPRCILKVIEENGRIATKTMMLLDQEASAEDLEEVEKTAATKYFYYKKSCSSSKSL